MAEVKYEWDEAKAASNLRKHKVSFEEAKLALADPSAIIEPDDTGNFTEGRGINNSRTICGDFL